MFLTITGLIFCMNACLFQLARANFTILALHGGDDVPYHVSFVNESNEYFPKHAEQNGYKYHSTDDKNQMNESNLKNYQVVMLLDRTPKVLSNQQQMALQKYVENGGGLIGFHGAGKYENASD